MSDSFNGPIILTKTVDCDRVTFHRRRDDGGVYVDWHPCQVHRKVTGLVGIGYSLTPDDLSVLASAPAQDAAAVVAAVRTMVTATKAGSERARGLGSVSENPCFDWPCGYEDVARALEVYDAAQAAPDTEGTP